MGEKVQGTLVIIGGAEDKECLICSKPGLPGCFKTPQWESWKRKYVKHIS